MNWPVEYHICYKHPSLSSLSPIEIFDTVEDARLYLQLRQKSKMTTSTLSETYMIKEVKVVE